MSRIDIAVVIGPDPNGAEACVAVGIIRTVAARLGQPVGDRTIFSGARQQVPFDGSRRLVPSALPPSLTQSTERLSSEFADAPPLPDTVNVTTRWSQTYTHPDPGPPRSAC